MAAEWACHLRIADLAEQINTTFYKQVPVGTKLGGMEGGLDDTNVAGLQSQASHMLVVLLLFS